MPQTWKEERRFCERSSCQLSENQRQCAHSMPIWGCLTLMLTHRHSGRAAQAFDLAGLSNEVGAPVLCEGRESRTTAGAPLFARFWENRLSAITHFPLPLHYPSHGVVLLARAI